MASLTATPALSAPKGSLANLTFVRQAGGTSSMRERKGGKRVQTPAQLAREACCRRVVAAWQTMDDPGRDAWEAYSALLHELGPTPSLSKPRAGYRVFSQLGLKALQASPGMAVPVVPPSAPFYGDGARVKAEPLPLGRGRGGALGIAADSIRSEDESTPSLPSPKGEEPGVRFACLAPNSPGVATELLVQPLASPGRKGEADKYRTRGFVSFAAAGETADVPCKGGTALVAVRFVDLATGGSSGIVPLGRIVVG